VESGKLDQELHGNRARSPRLGCPRLASLRGEVWLRQRIFKAAQEQDWPQGQEPAEADAGEPVQHTGQLRLRAAKLADDIGPGHAEGLPPIPQVSSIPFRPSPHFDPTVPAVHPALTAASTSVILAAPGRRRGTWSSSAATYVTCDSRSQRCSEIKPTALASPIPRALQLFSASPMPDTLASRTACASGMPRISR
jgi:hypothetical protein